MAKIDLFEENDRVVLREPMTPKEKALWEEFRTQPR